MEDGGIARRLNDNSAFVCLAKMLVAVIRTTIRFSWSPLGWRTFNIETDTEEDAVLLVACLPLMNEPDE